MSLRENELRRSGHAQRQHHKKRHKKRVRELLPPAPSIINDDQVLTFLQWCALNGLSRRTGRRIIHSPNSPVLTMLTGRMYGITVAANRAWQQSRAQS
jgi:hypothetical protein